MLFDLLGGGYAGSRILATRGERIVTEDYSPSGVAKYMVKDLDFATAIAAETDSPPGAVARRQRRLRGARRRGDSATSTWP